MSAFSTNGIFTVLPTDRIGFGVTLNPDGSIATEDGATMEYVTVAPVAVRNAGSIALRSNGTVYITTGAGAWFAMGGAGGTNWPDDVSAVWGTTAPQQVSATYVSASTRWDLLSGNETDADGSVDFRIRTGTSTETRGTGVVGGGSGPVDIRSGATDVTSAGGDTGGVSGTVTVQSGDTDCNNGASTGGASGPVTVKSGDATSTAGTSGNSGAVTVQSGSSADGNSGNVNLLAGTAASGVRGLVVATGLRTVSETAGAIAGATLLTGADSGGVFSVDQGSAYDIDLPVPLGAGQRYTFYLTNPGANNVTITVLGGGATFVGTIINDVTSVIPATGATLTFATGASALGDSIEVVSISAALYLVRAVTSAAGGITIA